MEWLDWNSFKSPIDEGLKFYSNLGRKITHGFSPDIFEMLNPEDDDCFLEPSLFACFNQDNPEEFIPSVLAAKILNSEDNFHFRAYSNTSGQVVFPDLCMLDNFAPNTWHSITLVKDKDEDKVGVIGVDEKDIRHLHPVKYDSSLLMTCRHALFDNLYWDRDGKICPSEQARLCHEDVISTFDKACRVLPVCNRHLYSAILQCCKGVIATRAEKINSFASETAQGIAFLNMESKDEASLIFFLEEMSHQCGHVIFSFLTADRSFLFKDDPHQKISDFTGNLWDKRDIYTIFHGVFTELAICETLSTAIENISVFTDQEQVELAGRLGYIVQRMRLDGSYLSAIDNLTQSGQDFKAYLLTCVDEALKDLYPPVRDMDFSNQPYNFCFPAFIQKNKDRRLSARDIK